MPTSQAQRRSPTAHWCMPCALSDAAQRPSCTALNASAPPRRRRQRGRGPRSPKWISPLMAPAYFSCAAVGVGSGTAGVQRTCAGGGDRPFTPVTASDSASADFIVGGALLRRPNRSTVWHRCRRSRAASKVIQETFKIRRWGGNGPTFNGRSRKRHTLGVRPSLQNHKTWRSSTLARRPSATCTSCVGAAAATPRASTVAPARALDTAASRRPRPRPRARRRPRPR
jgi:hypothetical protein